MNSGPFPIVNTCRGDALQMKGEEEEEEEEEGTLVSWGEGYRCRIQKLTS